MVQHYLQWHHWRVLLCANLVGIIGRREHDHRTLGTPIRFAGWIGDPGSRVNSPDQRIDIEDDVWVGYGSILLGEFAWGVEPLWRPEAW